MFSFDVIQQDKPYIFIETLNRSTIFMYWHYKPICQSEILKHSIKIYRRASETGEDTLLAEIPAIQTYYTDKTPHLKDLFRQYFYSFQIDDCAKTALIPVGQTYSGFTMKLRYNANTQLEFEGTPCLIYKRRTTGPKCTSCEYDAYTKEGSQFCEVCFGTGREGGYYPPLLTQVKIAPPEKTTVPAEVLKQLESTTATMGHYPILSSRDVILEVNRSRRWLVDKKLPGTETQRNIIAQDLMLVSINPTEIENSLPIVTDLTPIVKSRNEPLEYNFNVKEYRND